MGEQLFLKNKYPLDFGQVITELMNPPCHRWNRTSQQSVKEEVGSRTDPWHENGGGCVMENRVVTSLPLFATMKWGRDTTLFYNLVLQASRHKDHSASFAYVGSYAVP